MLHSEEQSSAEIGIVLTTKHRSLNAIALVEKSFSTTSLPSQKLQIVLQAGQMLKHTGCKYKDVKLCIGGDIYHFMNDFNYTC